MVYIVGVINLIASIFTIITFTKDSVSGVTLQAWWDHLTPWGVACFVSAVVWVVSLWIWLILIAKDNAALNKKLDKIIKRQNANFDKQF